MGLDTLADSELAGGYGQFLDDYDSFLGWKEQMGSAQISNDELDSDSRNAFSRYADFLHSALTHRRITKDLRRLLVL